MHISQCHTLGDTLFFLVDENDGSCFYLNFEGRERSCTFPIILGSCPCVATGKIIYFHKHQ